jgi:hypothetical protein
MEIDEKIEHVWFIYGLWIGSLFLGFKKYSGEGKEASVDFDWEKGTNPFVLGWTHTHPGKYGTNPSETDHKTMRSWVRGLGHSMISSIKCGQEESWYLYYRDEDKKVWATFLDGRSIGNFVFGKRGKNA